MFGKTIATFILSVTSFANPLAPSQILEKADQVRNPSESFQMRVKVVTPGEEESLFAVSTKGKDKTLIQTLEPQRDRGRNLLMLKENMWVYIPNLSRAVRINLNAKLTGQAANGDISRMRWAGDYDVVVEEETPTEWTLGLTANKTGLTYERIRVQVAKNTFHPTRAEYLSRSGKTLKTAEFSGYKTLAGGTRPSQILIADVTNPNKKSTIEILEMQVSDFEDSQFHQNNLRSQP